MAIIMYDTQKRSGYETPPLKKLRFSAKTPVEKQRAAYDKYYGAEVLPCNIDKSELTIGSPAVAADALSPELIVSNRTILYIHGGNFCAGSRFAAGYLCSLLCDESGARAFVPEYRLAPEHPYPAALRDIELVYDYILKKTDSRSVVVAGAGSGADLAVSLLLSLKESYSALPGGLLLLSPWLTIGMDGEFDSQGKKDDGVFSREFLKFIARAYATSPDPDARRPSPLKGNCAGFPEVLIQCGTKELFAEDARLFAAKAQDDGVEVTLEMWRDMHYLFQSEKQTTPAAKQAVVSAGKFIRRCADQGL